MLGCRIVSEVGNSGCVEVAFKQLLFDILIIWRGSVYPGASSGYPRQILGVVVVIADIVVDIASG